MTDHQEKLKKFFTGLFFVIGVLLFIWIIFTIGANKGFIEAKFKVPVLFEDVRGLTEGAPVRLSGVVVGLVERIDFLKKEYQGRRVKVTLSLFEKYKEQLNQSAQFSIVTDGILGEKLVVIKVTEDTRPLDLNSLILGDNPIDVQDLAEVFADAAESFTKTSNELSKINFQKLAEGMEQTGQSLVTTAESFKKILPEVELLMIKGKRLFNRIEQKIIEGNLFKIF
ncbi:MAG TPA: MlaD family protein [Candidatus Omnitrophota bacterium]|nr:MlaD family protein [Candidatus Omnitrophota bacterium]